MPARQSMTPTRSVGNTRFPMQALHVRAKLDAGRETRLEETGEKPLSPKTQDEIIQDAVTEKDHEAKLATARKITARALENASRRVVTGPGDF